MPNGAIPKVEDITDFAVKRPHFSTEDINQEFGLETRNTAAYLATMRRRGLIEPDEPTKVDGVSRWVYVGAHVADDVADVLRCIAELKRAGLAKPVSILLNAVAAGLVSIDDLIILLAEGQAQA